jgi:hypothetical protein
VGVEAKATQGGAKKHHKRREEGTVGQRGTGGKEVAEAKEGTGGGGGRKLNP